MRHRVLGLIAGIVLALSIGVVAAQPEEYDGAGFCRHAKAWPNGTYLGQMHPFHVQHYQRFAPAQTCERWAADQRASAINGLRAMGYTVVAPSDPRSQAPAPVPVVTQPPTPAAPTVAPGLEHAYAGYLVIAEVMRGLSLEVDPGPATEAFFDTMTIGPRATSVRITWGGEPSDRWAGRYSPSTHTITMSDRLRTESVAVQTAILTHEMVHAVAEPTTDRAECFWWERIAFTAQASAWTIYGYPGTATPMEQWLTRLVHIVNTPEFDQWVEGYYHGQCSWYTAEASGVDLAA